MKALLRVLKSEKYRSFFLLFILVLNSAVFVQVSGQGYVPSASANNIWCITDPAVTNESLGLNSSMNCGIVGNVINQAGNLGVTSAITYSGVCGQGGCEGGATAQAKLNEIYAKNNKFSVLNTIATVNTTLLDQRPASATDYVQDKIYALTHPNTVFAQATDEGLNSRTAYYSPGGTGFSLLRPIQNFWSWAVRVVYGFLLLIVVIIAFAIMFRQRLSGNVEVTIQNAIPSIALAMILVPLSYAISGLFIDVITVGSNAVHEFLIGADGSPGNQLYINSPNIKSYNLLGQQEEIGTGPGQVEDRGLYPDDARVDWLRARNNLNVKDSAATAAQAIGDATIFPVIDAIVKGLGQSSGIEPINFTWVGDIIQFLISIVTIWIGIKIFIELFKKYMTLILFPVLSPFIFATVAIPGNGTKSILQYCQVMLAASLAYIVTYAMFLLSIIFTSSYFQSDVPAFGSGSFNPPLIGLKSLGVQSNNITQILLTVIGLGIYFSVPSVLQSIDKALGADQPLPKFITTPWDSFNESRKVMFKSAPTAAISGVRQLVGGGRGLVRGTRNVANMPGAAANRVRQYQMDRINKQKGINADHPDSEQRKEASAISRKISGFEETARNQYDKGDYDGYKRSMALAQAERDKAEGLGVTKYLASNLKDEDKAKYEAVFKFPGGGDNEIVITSAMLLAQAGNANLIIPGGKLTIKASGAAKLPSQIRSLYFYDVKEKSANTKDKTLTSVRNIGGDYFISKGIGVPTYITDGQVFGKAKSLRYGADIPDVKLILGKAGAGVLPRPDVEKALTTSQTDNKFDIPFYLEITNWQANAVVGGGAPAVPLFGFANGNPANRVPTQPRDLMTGGIIDLTNAAEFLETGFKLNNDDNMSTNIIQIMLKYQQ